MPLPAGSWKANLNGSEVALELGVTPVSGVVLGRLLNTDVRGFWDESAQKIVFSLTVEFQGDLPVIALFTGYLFRTPPNPEPARDVVATMSGHFQMAVASSAAAGFVATATARRNLFGWFAQSVEVN